MEFVAKLNETWSCLAELSARAIAEPQPVPDPQPNPGWHKGPVVVRFEAPGDTQAIVVSEYRWDPETQTSSAARLEDHPPSWKLTLSGEGKTTLGYAAIGPRPWGGRGPQGYLDLCIDTHPPEVSCEPNGLTYTISDFVEISCEAKDALSDLQTPSHQSIQGDAYLFRLGENAVSVESLDNAGNVAQFDVSFRVIATFDSLDALTARFVTHRGIYRALQAKLVAAERAALRGDARDAAQHVAAYTRLLGRHVGRFVAAEQAAILIAAAAAL